MATAIWRRQGASRSALSSFAVREDLAPLILALLLGGGDPPLPLAGVLTRAAVLGRVACALPLARVDPLASDLFVRLSALRMDERRDGRGNEPGDGSGD